MMSRLNSRQTKTESQMGNNLLEDLLLEKSFDLDKFRDAREETETKKTLNEMSDSVLREGKKFEKSGLRADQLADVSEDAIMRRINRLMAMSLDASITS